MLELLAPYFLCLELHIKVERQPGFRKLHYAHEASTRPGDYDEPAIVRRPRVFGIGNPQHEACAPAINLAQGEHLRGAAGSDCKPILSRGHNSVPPVCLAPFLRRQGETSYHILRGAQARAGREIQSAQDQNAAA